VREIENFITDYPMFRSYCDTLAYEGVQSPVDGVFYPGVSLSIPQHVVDDVSLHLRIVDKMTRLNCIFLRLSLEGVKAPHQAHTDISMGQKSLMVYLSRPTDIKWGTAMLKHKTGLDYAPEYQEEIDVMNRDMNNPEMWEITRFCEALPNKGFIFDAGLIHRAEPIGGFGDSPVNGRLVLTAFYDC